MSDACDAVTGLVVSRDFGSKGNDCAGKVAPDGGTWGGEEWEVDVLPRELVSRDVGREVLRRLTSQSG
jgi:hypothetical protein